MTFLGEAFVAAVMLMFMILVLQFNNFYQAFVVVSAFVFSIAGVLLRLIIRGRPFGTDRGGVGVIALAGIVVNNNIVFIDTSNELRRSGATAHKTALRTGAQRLRPVFLKSIATTLGPMPMVLGMNIGFFGRQVVLGARSTQYWTELRAAIAGGLVIATIAPLVVTPAMLMLGHKRSLRHAPPAGESRA